MKHIDDNHRIVEQARGSAHHLYERLNLSKMHRVEVEQDLELRGQVFRGAGSAAQLARDWDDLFERAHQAPPYISRAWIQTFINEGKIKGTPLFITVWYGSKLVALLPLTLSSYCGIKVASIATTTLLCYNGILVDPKYHEAIRVVAEVCVREKVAHIFYNKYTSTKDKLTNELYTELIRYGFVSRHWQRHVVLQVHLEQNFDKVLRKNRNHKQREKILYHERRVFKSGDVKVTRYMKEQITPEVVARIAYIQENSWVKSQGGAILVQSFYQKLLAEMGKAGIGCVWLMTKGKDDIAFIYAFRIKDSQYLKWMAYRLEHGYSPTLSFGKVLYMQMVRDACKEGIRLLDLGFGQDSWKRLWATDSHNIERIIAGPSFIGHMTIFCYAILRFCARCKFLLGYRLRKLMNIRK